MGLWLLWRAFRKSPPGYSGDPSATPTTNPSTKLGANNPVKTFVTNCGQMMPDMRVVCTDSLWEHTIALPNRSIVDPLREPSPKTGYSRNAEHRPHCRVVFKPMPHEAGRDCKQLQCLSICLFVCNCNQHQCFTSIQ